MSNVLSKIFSKKVVIPVLVIIAVIILIANSAVIVPAGHTGVVLTLGRVDENVLQEGLHFKIPFIQDVVKIDNRITKLEVDTEAFSKDLQTVSTTIAINYRVETSMSYSIYKNIGRDYESVLVVPAVNEVLKAITANYTAEESVTNRTLVSNGLIDGLNEKLNEIGLYVTDVNIINFDFSDAYITAIEEKQVAQQQLLKAETEKQQQRCQNGLFSGHDILLLGQQRTADTWKARPQSERALNPLLNIFCKMRQEMQAYLALKVQ